jgi:hypothetical protein
MFIGAAHCPARVKYLQLGRVFSGAGFDTKRNEFRLNDRLGRRPTVRRILLIIMLLTAGCENLRGPLAPRSPMRVDDPSLSIAEQQALGRDRIGLPDNSSVLPPEAGARPGR